MQILEREDFKQLLEKLNRPQQEAALQLEGPLLILAGAGSGKTKTLTYRIAHLLAQGVSPHHVLAVTFTNKAAGEMKERIAALLGNQQKGLLVGTFHSTAVRILRKEAHHIGYESSFSIFDADDQVALVKEILKETHDDSISPNAVISIISTIKNRQPDFGRFQPQSRFERAAAQIFPLYQKKLKHFQAFDFDDLLRETVNLFESNREVRSRYEEIFQYILVDEYQDVNYLQYRFVKLLSENHRNLCVVGDDDQSIYSFRGGDVRLILRFEEDFPEARVIRLEQNYRCTSTILDTANAVIGRNQQRKSKQLWTENPAGENVILYEALNERQEARFVIQEIAEQIRKKNRLLSDFSILYRTNAQSRVLEEVLLQNGIPYRLIGGFRFYERKEIKDILAHLKILANPYDSLSFKRVLNAVPRGIGQVTFRKLEEFAAAREGGLFYSLLRLDEIPGIKGKIKEALGMVKTLLAELLDLKKSCSLPDLADKLLNLSGYRAYLEADHSPEAQARLENCNEFLTVAEEFEKRSEDRSLEAFLFHISLLTDLDHLEEGANSVTLMTLHSAKGLEFPVVFLTGMEEGIFPHSRSLMQPNEIEEERRLCYVGITRAREKLYLSYARERSRYGLMGPGEPSRFLSEILHDRCVFLRQQKDGNYLFRVDEDSNFMDTPP